MILTECTSSRSHSALLCSALLLVRMSYGVSEVLNLQPETTVVLVNTVCAQSLLLALSTCLAIYIDWLTVGKYISDS